MFFRCNSHGVQEFTFGPATFRGGFRETAQRSCIGPPFPMPPIGDLVVSLLGVVLKKEPNKFRLIHHLSFPKGGSVNDAIDRRNVQ